jgi:hypothetical protein
MSELSELRKRSGMSQFLCAQLAGISRMRLSLAETGQVHLNQVEESAVRRVIREFISVKAREIALLQEQGNGLSV